MPENNYAFIDSQNVNLGIRAMGWQLDFAKFRIYLREKYDVNRAYLFIGYVPGNDRLYTALQSMGYICVFKPTLIRHDGKIKGNCDAELVLQSMIDYAAYDTAIIVTGDGDFYCLVRYWIEKKKLKAIIVPNESRYSALLKLKASRPYLRYMNNLREKLSYKKESPHKDGTL